ncbi:TRAP transporter small permease [Variovorax sp. VNK109]|jgi:TRAP-type C4-dicarboxylate transport system permease small subunit|uniref:TRAP transporter small permease n=1 Tax=Variovorax sp. VNK109 TaxID=3400919 RepID=UPI003C0C592A
MDKAFRYYCRALEALIAAGLFVMVVLVFGNVALRYIFNSGISVSEEMSRWFFIWITFLGAIVALRERAHLGTSMLLDRLNSTGKKVCLVIAYVMMIGTSWLVLRGAWEQARINLDVTAPSSGASMAIFYASGIVFAVSAILILLADLWGLVSGRITPEALAAMRESEEEPA